MGDGLLGGQDRLNLFATGRSWTPSAAAHWPEPAPVPNPLRSADTCWWAGKTKVSITRQRNRPAEAHRAGAFLLIATAGRLACVSRGTALARRSVAAQSFCQLWGALHEAPEVPVCGLFTFRQSGPSLHCSLRITLWGLKTDGNSKGFSLNQDERATNRSSTSFGEQGLGEIGGTR
jgi:hypothetical protein